MKDGRTFDNGREAPNTSVWKLNVDEAIKCRTAKQSELAEPLNHEK